MNATSSALSVCLWPCIPPPSRRCGKDCSRPSEASWKRGAERLAGAPELSGDVEEVAVLGRQPRDLAHAAAANPARADLYGSIMATCSTCHRCLSIEPQ